MGDRKPVCFRRTAGRDEATPTTEKLEVKTRADHAVVHRVSPECWTWICLCGSGVHSSFAALRCCAATPGCRRRR